MPSGIVFFKYNPETAELDLGREKGRFLQLLQI